MSIRRMAMLATVACLAPGRDTKIGSIHYPGTLRQYRLMAVGQRTMSFLRFPLYSLGLYCQFQENNCGKDLKEALLSGKEDWCIRIVPIRNVNLNHMRGAYGRRLSLGLEGREEFLAAFPNTSLPMERSSLLIEWTHGELWIIRQGEEEEATFEAGPIRSLPLAQAIMGIYLGDGAAIPALEADLADSLRQLE